MHWEINKCVGLDLLQYLLYHRGLELNLEYLWRLPGLCCFVVLFQLWLFGYLSSLSLAAVSLWQGPIVLFFDHLLTFWHSDRARKYLKYPKLALYFLCPCPKISCFPRVPWLTMLEPSAWPLVCTLLPAVTASKPLQWIEPWNSHK